MTEVTAVMALAGIVTLGLVTFYFNAQSTWVDASVQALTQREATGLVREITESVRASVNADGTTPDRLVLHYASGDQAWFSWEASDSLIHRTEMSGVRITPLGPRLTSPVTQFHVEKDSAMVHLRFALRTPSGRLVESRTSAAFYNR